MPTINPNITSLWASSSRSPRASFPRSPNASSPRRRGSKNIDTLKKPEFVSLRHNTQTGFSLIEMIVFIVVISIALGALLAVYQQSVVSSVDPIKRIRMLEVAQAQLDRVIALRYDEATPMGGVPACNTAGGDPCTNSNDGGFDDLDDYNGFPDTSGNYSLSVTVTPGTYDSAEGKQVSVTVTAPDNETLTLTSYRYNF